MMTTMTLEQLGRRLSSKEIKHEVFSSENVGKLYLSGDYSDLTIIVGGQRFKTHKLILAAQSKFFEAMLFGNFDEASKAEIELVDISADGFDETLKYIYTGQLSLRSLNYSVVLGILQIAHMYQLTRLSNSIIDYLKENITVENVCCTLQTASELNLMDLIKDCLLFVDKNAAQILQSEKFLRLSSNVLSEIISRDTFFVSEIQIFRGVQEWMKSNPSENAKDTLKHVRLELMTQKELLSDVRRSGFVSFEEIFDAQEMALEAQYSQMRYRGLALDDENVAQIQYQAKVITGSDNGLFQTDGRYASSNNWSDGNGITIDLGSQYLINHISFVLYESDVFYYVEISVDKNAWLRVIDYSNFCCYGWQNLYFEPKVVKFIRIVGVKSLSLEADHLFSIVRLKAKFTLHHEDNLEEQFIRPSRNVAPGASVISYGCKNYPSMLDDYNIEDNVTTPDGRSNSIVIQLQQPHVIDSIRMLLRELDDHCYSYWIETSGNFKDWEFAVDKRQEECQGWQILTFDRPRPVVFIRITATPESVKQGFGLVRFECPAPPPAPVDDKKNKKLITH